MSSAHPLSCRSSGITATPARAIAPARPVRTVRPATSTATAVEGDQARQQVAELALPVALDARHPHDLAGTHVEAEPVEDGDAVAVHGGVA